jgi:polysaccharide export outer membrane protein
MIVRLSVVLALCVSVTACGATRSALRMQQTQDPPAAETTDATVASDEGAKGIASAGPVITLASTADSADLVPASAPAAAPVAKPAVATFDAAADFRIGAEDLLDVQVWKNCPELCRTVPVRPDGKVSLPLVNDIQAAGLTTNELRMQVTQRLAEFIPSPEVSVIVREVHSVKVSVVGAVRMPGHYEVNSAATVLDLIARAQGLTEFANRDRIVVKRQNGAATKQISFNYTRVAEGKDENPFVQPGDIIVVP